MSFLSDLLEGNFGNLGEDVTQTVPSLLRNPTQLLETAGAALLPFIGPEALTALGIGDVGAAAIPAATDAAAAAAAPAAEEAALSAGAPLDILAEAGAPTADAAATAGGGALTGDLASFFPAAAESGAFGDLGVPVGATNGIQFLPTTASVDAAAAPAIDTAAPSIAATSAPQAAASTVASPLEAVGAGNQNIMALASGGPSGDLSGAEGIQAINQAMTGPSTLNYAQSISPAAGITDAAGNAVPFTDTASNAAALASETGGGAEPILSNPTVADVGPTVGGQALNFGGGAAPADTTAAFASPTATTQSEILASNAAPGGASTASGGAENVGADVQSGMNYGSPSSAAPNLWDTLSNAGGGLKNLATNPLLQLAVPGGMLAYDLMKGPQPIPGMATAAVQNAIQQQGPLQGQAQQNVPLYNQTAAQDLNQANAFQISPAQAAALNQWKQDQYNQLYQQIANQGNTNPTSSSEWVQGKNQIDQQALAQQTQMINQLVSTAFQASTAANAGVQTASNVTSSIDNLLMQTAQLQVAQDASFNQAVGSAMQAFGLVAGLNAGNFNKMANAATTATG